MIGSQKICAVLCSDGIFEIIFIVLYFYIISFLFVKANFINIQRKKLSLYQLFFINNYDIQYKFYKYNY
jgi:hypothetical protein